MTDAQPATPAKIIVHAGAATDADIQPFIDAWLKLWRMLGSHGAEPVFVIVREGDEPPYGRAG